MKKLFFVLGVSVCSLNASAAGFGFYAQCADDQQCHLYNIHTDADHGVTAPEDCGIAYSAYAKDDTCHEYTACGLDLGRASESECQTSK